MNGRRPHYGHVIVAAGAAIQAVGVGTYVAFGVFFGPLLAEFGWSRAVLSGAHSSAFLVAGVVGILIGRLSDRFGPRLLMTGAAALFGLGLGLLSQVRAPWQLYVSYSLVFGIGLGAVDVIALTTTARWFVRRRGAMTGIVKMGTGAGQLAMPLVATALITSLGWRLSYLMLGAAAMLLLGSAAQVLRRDPAAMGLLPDAGIPEARTEAAAPSEGGSNFRQALWTRQLWTILLANLAAVFALMIVMLHIVPHAIDLGVAAPAAAGLLSTIGGVSMLGRFTVGNAIDRIGARRSMVACFALLIGVLLWLQAARELWMLYLFAAAYGFTHGGFFTLISPIVAEYFGLRSHGLLLGLLVCAGTVGGFAGPLLAGHIFDVTASYRLAVWMGTGSAAAGLALVLTLGPAEPCA
ncbi:MAG: MFS transporter [Deferrisomatales bacterium]|nr:MFS transporter [Deferrisomatales bacterium]